MAEKLEKKHVKYVREYPAYTDMSSPLGKSWRDSFGVNDKKSAELFLKNENYAWEWLSEDRLKTIGPRMPLFIKNNGGEDNEQQIAVDNLDSLLKAVGLEHLLETLAAAQFSFKALRSLAQHDTVCCTNELKEAGITAPGHRVEIIAALLQSVLPHSEGMDSGRWFDYSHQIQGL